MRIESVYYAYVALMTFGLGVTVTAYAPFLQHVGLSLSEIALVNGAFWVLFAGMELPTGMLADGRARTWSIKWGIALQGLGAAGYFFACGFWSVLLAEITLGVGMAFTSGAHQAWLVDALKAEGREGDKRRALGTAAMVRGACMIVGGMSGAAIYAWSPAAVWLPYVALTVPAWILVRRAMDGRGNPDVKVTEREALAKSVSLLRASPSLAWALAAFMLFGLVLPFNHYWSPYLIATYGQGSVSLAWPGMYLCVIAGGYLVRRATFSPAQEAHALGGALVAAGLGLAFIPLFGGVAGPMAALFLHELARGAFEPLMDAYVHHRVESSYRATYASLQSFLGKGGYACVPLVTALAVAGLPDGRETIAATWIAAGTLMAASALVLLLLRPRCSPNASS